MKWFIVVTEVWAIWLKMDLHVQTHLFDLGVVNDRNFSSEWYLYLLRLTILDTLSTMYIPPSLFIQLSDSHQLGPIS